MSEILLKFLSRTNFKHLLAEFDDSYKSHPNYPSLFAITDTFTRLNIENLAANVPKDQLSELPTNFLAYFNDEMGPALPGLVKKKNHQLEVLVEGEDKRVYTIKEFNSQWNGIVVVIEENELERKLHMAWSVKLWIGLVSLFALAHTFNLTVENVSSYLVYTVGLLISFLIIKEKLNDEKKRTSAFCSLNESTSCDAVINSKQARITSWLDFSDLPVLFFGTAVLTMLIAPSSYLLINTISLISLPMIIYTVWLQRVQLKAWCTLCLTVSGLLLLLAGMTLLHGIQLSALTIAPFVAAAIVAPSWFWTKEQLNRSNELEKANAKMKRFKRSYKLFSLLQEPLKYSLSELAGTNRIQIGEKTNPIELTLILSPSCGHCHTAFENGLKLHQSNPTITKLSIFYNLNIENKENPTLEVARNTLQLNSESTQKALDALSDWHIKRMSLVDWLFKWEQSRISTDIDKELKRQYEWCVQNDFNYAPVKIVNNKEYPKEYALNELSFFFTELEEEAQV